MLSILNINKENSIYGEIGNDIPSIPSYMGNEYDVIYELKEFIRYISSNITYEEIYNKLCSGLDFIDKDMLDHENNIMDSEVKRIYYGRYTPIGAAEFLYLYNLTKGDNIYIESIKSFLNFSNYKWTNEERICKTLLLLCYSVFFCITTENKPNIWVMYDGIKWNVINFNSMVIKFRSLLKSLNMFKEETIDSYIQYKGQTTLTYYFDNKYFYERIDTMNYFVMKGITYQTVLCYHRICLPSDFSTKYTEYIPKYDNHNEVKYKIYDAMKCWIDDEEIIDTICTLLSISVGVYLPREIMINFGTGSDGKTTFMSLLKCMFGTYFTYLTPGTLSQECKDPNSHTSAYNAIPGSKIVGEPDSRKSGKTVGGAVAKSLSGGEGLVYRKLFGESIHSDCKPLMMLNTNRLVLDLDTPADVTRVIILKWKNKYLTSSSRTMLPDHVSIDSKDAQLKYSEILAKDIGQIFLTELIYRHKKFVYSGNKYIICDKLLIVSKSIIQQSPVNRYISERLKSVQDNSLVDYYSALQDLVEPSLDTLYADFCLWSAGKRIRENNMAGVDFKLKVSLIIRVEERINKEGYSEEYVVGMKLSSINMESYQNNINYNFNQLPGFSRKRLTNTATLQEIDETNSNEIVQYNTTSNGTYQYDNNIQNSTHYNTNSSIINQYDNNMQNSTHYNKYY